MKKSFILSLLCVFLFSGCNKDNDSVRICADFIATVVSNTEGNCLVELDGGVKYYTSQTLNRSFGKFEVGDRLYFRYFEINYDRQPAGADGSFSQPYEIVDLIYEPMEVFEPVVPNEEVNALENNKLNWFFAPYLEQTTIKRNYLNLSFAIPERTKPEFNLIYQGTQGDTLLYDFKTTFTENPNSQIQVYHIETFEMKDLPTAGYLQITFNSKNYDSRISGFLSDSTFILPFDLNEKQ